MRQLKHATCIFVEHADAWLDRKGALALHMIRLSQISLELGKALFTIVKDKDVLGAFVEVGK